MLRVIGALPADDQTMGDMTSTMGSSSPSHHLAAKGDLLDDHNNDLPSSSQPSLGESSDVSARTVEDNPRYPSHPHLTRKVIATIASLANGDGRVAVSLLELALSSSKDSDEAVLLSALRRSVSTSYDRTGDSHYDAISGKSSFIDLNIFYSYTEWIECTQ